MSFCEFQFVADDQIRCRRDGCRRQIRWTIQSQFPKMRCRSDAPPAAKTDRKPCGSCGHGKTTGAQDMPLPSPARRAYNFAGAEVRDRLNGRRRRTPEQVERLFTAHCSLCEFYNRAAGACSKCGCPVNLAVSEGLENRLAAAAEACPLKPPAWPYPAIAKRNLMFYLLPLRHSGRVWQWHVEQLRRYLPLFNGRRIVTIATPGPESKLAIEPAELVRQEFGEDAESIEFLERPNDADYWELPAFREMLESLASTAADEATFYFHAKGVRRARQGAIRPWCQEIYRHNLGRIDDAQESLRYWQACGIAARNQDPTNLASRAGGWHFAGTGFWFRHDALFRRPNWREIKPHSHAVEGYLATQFSRDEVFCLAHDAIGDVYEPAVWQRAIAADANRPAAGDGKSDPADVRVSVIVTARNYGHWLRECLASCLRQEHAPLEVIYVDDASTDDSPAIAAAVDGVQVVALQQHLGVADARNEGAKRAQGNALLFVDADNLLPRDYLQKMVDRLSPSAPYVYGDLSFFGDETGFHKQPEWHEFDLWTRNQCDTCSLIWREAFELAGGWTAGDWCAQEDWHLFLRLSFFGSPRRADVALGYRRHGASLTAASGRDRDPALAAAAAERIRADVSRWAIEKFGRVPSRAERDLGVTAAAPREVGL